MHLVLGLTYSFLIVCAFKQNRSSDKEMIYHFTVSRDRGKDYHVFRKTFSEPPSGDQSSSHYHLLSKGMDTCINMFSQTPPAAAAAAHLFFPGKLPGGGNFSALSVRVASYNIWNVNALEDKGEDYETRLERLSKVTGHSKAQKHFILGVIIELCSFASHWLYLLFSSSLFH